MQIGIDVSKAIGAMDRINARLESLTGKARKVEEFVLRDAAVALGEVKERFPVGSRGEEGDRTGPHMVEGWRLDRREEGPDTVISVTHPLSEKDGDAPHILKILNDGSKAHPITARNWPTLYFYWKKMGFWANPRSVKHPGTRPYLFVTIPAAKARDRIQGFLKSLTSGKAK